VSELKATTPTLDSCSSEVTSTSPRACHPRSCTAMSVGTSRLRKIAVHPPPDSHPHETAPPTLLRGTGKAAPHSDRSIQRSFDIHPVRPLLAVALPDDSLRFVYMGQSEADVQYQGLALTHEFQRDCYSVSWSPLSEVIAVGTKHGVCLWRLLPDEGAWMAYLQHPRRKAAHALTWCPYGRHLAAISRDEACVLVWDVAARSAVPLHCSGLRLGKPKMVRWSPDGLYLLVTFQDDGFAIWETKRWTCESFRFGGACRAVTWSPCGSMVVLAMEATDPGNKKNQPLFVGCIYAAANGTQFGVEWLLASLPQAVHAGGVVCSGATASDLSFTPDGTTLAVAFESDATSSAIVTYQFRRQPSLTFSVAKVLDVRDGPAPDELKFSPSLVRLDPNAPTAVLSALRGSELTLFAGVEN